MTREEAIKLLRKLRETIDRNNAYGEAEEMGIQALEQEPCDVFDKYGNYKYPSDVELTEPNTATSMPCEDTISRQAVLDIDFKRIILTTAKPAEMIEQKVKSLPSVTPQLKTGHWIEEDMFDGDVAYRCSECNELFWIEDGTPKDNEYNFCPKCGKRLVEPTCDTCEYITAAFNPCNACKDKSEYVPQKVEDEK